VADQVRTRLALLIRALREQRGWSQAEFGQRLGKPQSVVSRLEDPDYKTSLQSCFEVAAALGLPLYVDMPNWDEWFSLMDDMSSRGFRREPFNADRLSAHAEATQARQRLVGSQQLLQIESDAEKYDEPLHYYSVTKIKERVESRVSENRLLGLEYGQKFRETPQNSPSPGLLPSIEMAKNSRMA